MEISPEVIQQNGLLQSLSPTEELAMFLALRGHCLLEHGHMQEARTAYHEARRYAPHVRTYRLYLEDVKKRIADHQDPVCVRLGVNPREIPPTLFDPKYEAVEALEFNKWQRERMEKQPSPEPLSIHYKRSDDGKFIQTSGPEPEPPRVGHGVDIRHFRGQVLVDVLDAPQLRVQLPFLKHQNPTEQIYCGKPTAEYRNGEILLKAVFTNFPDPGYFEYDLRRLGVDSRDWNRIKIYWLDDDGAKKSLR